MSEFTCASFYQDTSENIEQSKQLNSLNTGDISDEKNSNFNIKTSSQPIRGKLYTQSEDLKIIDYILKNESNFLRLSRREFFQQLQRSQIVSRSVKSLYERLATIAAHIDSYGFSEKEIKYLKKLFSKKKYIFYTKEDDMKILNYIMDHNEGCRVRGDKLWEEMALNKVTDHSRKSMSSRFHKRILPNIKKYNIPAFQIKRMIKNTSDFAPFCDDSSGGTEEKYVPVVTRSKTRSNDFHSCTSASLGQLQAVALKMNKLDIRTKSCYKRKYDTFQKEIKDKDFSLSERKLPISVSLPSISILRKQPPICPLHSEKTVIKQEPGNVSPLSNVPIYQVTIKKGLEAPSVGVENIVDDPSTELSEISGALSNYANSSRSTPMLISESESQSLEFEIDSQDDHKISTFTQRKISPERKCAELNSVSEKNALGKINMLMLHRKLQESYLILSDSLDEICGNNDKNSSLPISANDEKSSSSLSCASLPAMPSEDITSDIRNQFKSVSPKSQETCFSGQNSKIDSCLPSNCSSTSYSYAVPLDDFDAAMLEKMQNSIIAPIRISRDSCSVIPQSSTAKENSGPCGLHSLISSYVDQNENNSSEILSDQMSSVSDYVSCKDNIWALSTQRKQMFIVEAVSLMKNIENIIATLESGTTLTVLKRKIAELNLMLYESNLENEAECILKKPQLSLADKATLIKLLACREKSTPQNVLKSIARNISDRS